MAVMATINGTTIPSLSLMPVIVGFVKTILVVQLLKHATSPTAVLNAKLITAPFPNATPIAVKPIFKPAPQPVNLIAPAKPGQPISPARIHIIIAP